MKKIVVLMASAAVLFASPGAFAQAGGPAAAAPGAGLKELQKLDPQTAQAIMSAIQRGDLQTAERLLNSAKTLKQEGPASAPTVTAAAEQVKPSLFEQTLAGSLTQFGYDLFNRTASSFIASGPVAVGPDYILGPGDSFTMTLWGTTEGIYNLTVSKEGQVTLPKVGVVPLAGVRFGELERTLKRQLSRYYGDFNLSIAMGGLKTVSIYVVGEVVNPGSYSLSSLSTTYSALFAAGGPTKKGTLRAVQVLRSGKVIKTIDLYDFLLKGDRSQDMKLQTEDTVFVPLIGPVAGIAGGVYRPAIYELKGTESIDEVIRTAGGILPLSLGGRLQLVRYEGNQKKVILDLKLEDRPSGGSHARKFTQSVLNMDSIIISLVYDQVWETVDLEGAVEHPGSYQWKPDLTVRELIRQGTLLPKADLKRAEVVRVDKDVVERRIIPIDLAALAAGDEKQNILLQPKDKVKVYTVEQNAGNLWETVTLTGVVRNQGNFQWKQGMTVRDVIVQGQLLPSSDLTRADVIRLNKGLMDRTVIPVNLGALMSGDEAQNLMLEPQDQIRVYSSYKSAEKVSLGGEVQRTGEYEINKGERLSDLLKRAGGFTAGAYPYGVVFRRASVKSSETKNMKALTIKMQSDILQTAAGKAAAAVTPEDVQTARSEQGLNQGLFENLKAMQEQLEGRIALNITADIEQWTGSENDLLLQDGDAVLVPKRPQEVLVLGEVYSPGAQIFLPGMSVKEYIQRSGGTTRNAEFRQVFVVQANGYAYGADSAQVKSIENMKLQAGDAVFVPQKVERHGVLRVAKDIIEVLFKAAVIIATIHVVF